MPLFKTIQEKKQLSLLAYFGLTLVTFLFIRLKIHPGSIWGTKDSIVALSFLYPPIFYFLIYEKLIGKIPFNHKTIFHFFPFILFTFLKNAFQWNFQESIIPNETDYIINENLNKISILYLLKEIQLDSYLVLDIHLILSAHKFQLLLKNLHEETRLILIVYLAIIVRILLNSLFFKTFFFIDINFNVLYLFFLFAFIYCIIESIRVGLKIWQLKSPNIPQEILAPIIHLTTIDKPIIFEELKNDFRIEAKNEGQIFQKQRTIPPLSPDLIGIIEDTIQEYLKDHPTRDQKFNKYNLVNHLGIPEYQLNQYFNKHLRISFKDWKTHIRIIDSNQLIRSGFLISHTVDALARTVGFQSRSRFVQAFSKINNCTPSQFLREEKEGIS